ncbi:Uncharacterised protein [Mycobacteroides abscessus subsp. abscessus]|nr:Uncharacterised protein [Mycobacteroides abscessus subsp. abscessus]
MPTINATISPAGSATAHGAVVSASLFAATDTAQSVEVVSNPRPRKFADARK